MFSETVTSLKPGRKHWYWTEAKNAAEKNAGWDSGIEGFKTTD
jgi:hypothetical protein